MVSSTFHINFMAFYNNNKQKKIVKEITFHEKEYLIESAALFAGIDWCT